MSLCIGNRIIKRRKLKKNSEQKQKQKTRRPQIPYHSYSTPVSGHYVGTPTGTPQQIQYYSNNTNNFNVNFNLINIGQTIGNYNAYDNMPQNAYDNAGMNMPKNGPVNVVGNTIIYPGYVDPSRGGYNYGSGGYIYPYHLNSYNYKHAKRVNYIHPPDRPLTMSKYQNNYLKMF